MLDGVHILVWVSCTAYTFLPMYGPYIVLVYSHIYIGALPLETLRLITLLLLFLSTSYMVSEQLVPRLLEFESFIDGVLVCTSIPVGVID